MVRRNAFINAPEKKEPFSLPSQSLMSSKSS